jgi:hypothetical protein
MEQEIKIYQLKRPVTLGEYTCTEVKLCRPRTKDFVAVGRQTFDMPGAIVSMLSSISGIPEAVINQIDVDDISILRIEVLRMGNTYFTTEPYVLNPPPPPAEKKEAGTEAGI